MADDIKDLRELARQEPCMRSKVVAALTGGSKTVPELAQVLRCPVEQVMFWLMSARRYGYVAEVGEVTDEGYHKYRIVQKA